MENDNNSLMLLLLYLANPYISNEHKTKEVIKCFIDNLNIYYFHKTNMKVIVDRSNTIEDIAKSLFVYKLIWSIPN